jgi:hypothetical protein
MAEEGGTRIKRNRGPPPPDQQQMQMGQMGGGGPPPSINPRQQQQMQQMPPQYQQQMSQAQYQQSQAQYQPQIEVPSKSFFKDKFSSSFTGNSNVKTAFLVTIIFFMLNSKLFWTQLTKLPMMGGYEPSMIALIVNSILAGIAYYLITKFLISDN